jgi:sarcosine oxidase subunit beta
VVTSASHESGNALNSVDVAIVGGGLLGTATAHFASSAGLSVALFERSDLASGASGAAFGGVSVSIYSYASPRVPAAYIALSKASLELYGSLQEELGEPMDFVRPGSLDPFLDPAEEPARAERVVSLREAGIDVEIVRGEELHEIEPAISAAIPGASYSPTDGHVTPPNAVLAFAGEARRNGAAIHTGVDVHGVLVEGNRVTGLRTSNGDIACGWVVIAAGTATAKLAATAGVDVPLHVSRGQMFVTERLPHLVSTYLHTIKQTPSGTIVIGATREPGEDVPLVTADGTASMLAEAAELVPALRGVRLLRSWAGIRPVPPDGYPILGPTGVDGLLVAVMHRGVTLAPVVGRTLTELMTVGTPTLDIDDYRLSRFHDVPGPAESAVPSNF